MDAPMDGGVMPGKSQKAAMRIGETLAQGSVTEKALSDPPAGESPGGSTLSAMTVPIKTVQPYAANPRKNTAAVSKVAASLEAFGWRQPIVVDEDGVIIAGHTRLQAAESLGMTSVPVHVATDLTPAQVRAYRIADNRVGQDAEWDDALLAAELVALGAGGFDLGLTGFSAEELLALTEPAVITVEDADSQEVPEPPAKPITVLGDRILLGRHVLVCGDARDADVWAALMEGATADAMWTDPPYGVNYSEVNVHRNKYAATKKKAGVSSSKGKSIETPIECDSLTEEGLRSMLATSLGLAWQFSRPGAAWYVAAPPGPTNQEFGAVLRGLGVWRQTLIWAKDTFSFGRSDYHYRHEPLFYGWKDGAAHSWFGGRSLDTVLEFPRPRKSELHPTMKPVALIAHCLSNSVTAGDLVLDPFSGSGSTLMACETANLSARCLELSPAYCDVIVKRWEAATGAVAVRP